MTRSLRAAHRAALSAVCILALATVTLAASRTFTFEEPEVGTPDAACDTNPKLPMFNRAGFSGSTGTYIATPLACGEGTLGGSFGNDTLLTALFSASPNNSAELRFSWSDPANDRSWARVTTSGAGVFPNPTVYLGVGGKISMKIAVFGQDASGAESPAGGLEFVPLVRESGVLVPLGADGGPSGAPIEFLGIDSKDTSTPLGGALLMHSSTRQFHTIEWEITGESDVQVSIDGVPVARKVISFNLGNGKLDAPASRGTLEALGIRKPTDDVTKKWFVNIDDVVISAPGVTDPVAIRTPVLWTDTSVTVVNVSPEADELRLYKGDELIKSDAPPFSGAGEHTFTGVTLAIGDILTATQVIDGIESARSNPVNVQPPGIRVAIGVRELASVTNPQVGGNGGATGGIELVGAELNTSGPPGGQVLRMSPCWQTFTVNTALPETKVRGFAGAGANGQLDGAAAPWHVLEHIAFTIDSANPYSGPYTIYIDSLENAGVLFGGFDQVTLPAANGTWMFRQPSFSGSTNTNLAPDGPTTIDPNISQVVNEIADSGPNALKVQFKFKDNLSTAWLRLTTFNVANLGNPLIRLDQPLHIRLLVVPAAGLGSGPTITKQPTATDALIGDKATFTVEATGTGALHYQWLKNGVPVGGDSATLELLNVQESDAGLYSVSICDDSGPVHSEQVALTVLPCPRPFADMDRDQDVDQADFAVFQRCFTGAELGGGNVVIGQGCTCLNRDGDPADIDEIDLDAFLNCITGPEIEWRAEDTPNCVP